MATFAENFRGGVESVLCQLCGQHRDSQYLGFTECRVLAQYIHISGNYEDIFIGVISRELASTLTSIEKC